MDQLLWQHRSFYWGTNYLLLDSLRQNYLRVAYALNTILAHNEFVIKNARNRYRYIASYWEKDATYTWTK